MSVGTVVTRPSTGTSLPSRSSASVQTTRTDVVDAGDDGLPRSQVGTTPQHLLMTLLGDYWLGRTELLPSAAIVELLAEFDISEPSARAALNRLTKRGLLVSSKRGRKTYYGLAPRALPLLEDTLKRIVAFGTHEEKPWDGAWTVVAFSVPEAQRQLRHAVRTNLRWLGFAALYDGLWCSPWDERDAALTVLSQVGVESATVMRSEIDERSTMQALSAWDLDALKLKYAEFEREFSPMLLDARRGALTASQALIERTKLMDSWRQFLGDEPNLPADLLPEDWPRARMRELFIELYDSLAPVAKARCQQIVTSHSPDLAELVTPHTAAEPVA
jgi:phenylacetic acid degradation operon negative regulatory protein